MNKLFLDTLHTAGLFYLRFTCSFLEFPLEGALMTFKTTLRLVKSIFIFTLSNLSYGDPAPPIPPPNTGQAMQDGRADGHPDGSREGQVRGPTEGSEAGRRAGYSAGFSQCEREEKDRHYQKGLQEGYRQGEYEGEVDGQRQGQLDGEREGARDGKRDGEFRADQDSKRDATPPGKAKGVEEANQSDASEQGYAAGLLAGDHEAKEKALAFDYPRGRTTYREERFAEPIEFQDDFSQNALLSTLQPHHDFSSHFFRPLTHSANPDFRYYRPRRQYPTTAENEAYQSGYRSGYIEGFNSNYSSAFNFSYNTAYRQYWDRGCQDARNQNYHQDYQRGFLEGKRQGYTASYQRAYDNAYRPAYDQNFRKESEATYRETYPLAYNRHFEAARAQAYAERYQVLYTIAFERGKKLKFDEMYPRYAEQEYQRGRADEAEEFRLKPVRLIDSVIVESFSNGLTEPGESLRFKLQLRNFSEQAIQSKDVRVQLQALDAESAVITEGDVTLAQDLRRKSSTSVRNILEFRLNESVVNKTSRFQVQIFYQGRPCGEQNFNLVAQYMMNLNLHRKPELSEGIATPVSFKIKNQSNTQTDSHFKLLLRSDPSLIEIPNSELTIGILNPGEERIVSFKVIARVPLTSVQLPIALEGLAENGRRIGLLDQLEQVPVLNDYKIGLKTDITVLRKPGLIRADYTIRNVNSRFILKGLQLLARIKNETDSNFAILGPNPQYLNPIVKNQTLSFLIPVLSKTENKGGILELEVQEDGRVVVIHQAKF